MKKENLFSFMRQVTAELQGEIWGLLMYIKAP